MKVTSELKTEPTIDTPSFHKFNPFFMMAALQQDAVKTCPRGHGIPDLLLITQSFSLGTSHILNAYIVGSHVWGTCTKHSDWDLVIIIESGPLKAVNAHKGRLDAWIVSVEEHTANIRDHLVQALITVWLPECFVLKEESNPRTLFTYTPQSLLISVEKMQERDLRIARKHFDKGDHNRGSKVLRHCLRQMVLALQICHHGIIRDYTDVSQEEEILKWKSYERSSWHDTLSLVRPRMEAIITELKSSH